MECFDAETLSMYLDNELDPQRRQDMVVHLSTCQSCTAKLRALRESDTMRSTALVRARSTPAPGSTCYGAEELSAYASGLLTTQEAQPLEQHLLACDVCLKEVMAIHSTLSRLRRGDLIPPPARLVTAAKQEFATVGAKATVEKLGILIIQVAREGLKFIEAAFLPEHAQLAVGGHLIPAGAFRGVQDDTDAAALIDIRQSVGDLELRIYALHEDQQTVLLRLQIRMQGKPLAHRRVSLSSNSRTLSANQTSDAGEVEFPRLTLGDYTIRLPQENIETQFILRASLQEGQAG